MSKAPGTRWSEVPALGSETLTLREREFTVVAKGDRVRRIPLSRKTTRALNDYLLVRSKHEDVDLEALWLGAAVP